MGGPDESTNKNKNYGETLEDHDFFGGGRDEDEDDYASSTKKKKSKNDDPLAFLKRAQQEKENNAEREIMAEKEAKAAFKMPDELNYNLLNQYMDQNDKWKKALGTDLYK